MLDGSEKEPRKSKQKAERSGVNNNSPRALNFKHFTLFLLKTQQNHNKCFFLWKLLLFLHKNHEKT